MSRGLRYKTLADVAGGRFVGKEKAAPLMPAIAPKDQAQPKGRLQALGRLAPGEMNKTEQRFADEWIAPRMLAGDLVWWKFEAITLKLARDCRLTIDFFVMHADGRLEAYDVKGAPAVIQDDAKAKTKVASGMFPWAFFYAFPVAKKDGGGWALQEVKP